MAEKTEGEKLEILLSHWVEHNQRHSKEFEKWAERAKALGMTEAYIEIMNAAQQMEKVNKHLLKAREKLGP